MPGFDADEAVADLQNDRVRFVVDNVERYVTSENKKQGKRWSDDDFPVCSPPFDRIWIESEGLGEKNDVPEMGRYGITMDAEKLPDDSGWLILGGTWTEVNVRGDAGVLFPTFLFDIGVGKSGRIESFACNWMKDFPYDGGVMVSMAQAYLVAPLLAISFMHCKNVTMTEHAGEPSRRRHKKTKPGRLSYHTLQIEPMKKVLRAEGRSDEVGLRQALHICRGHFKDYRESGLFGRHKGIFWWDAQVRGSADEGIACKDYAVSAPRQESAGA